MSSPGRKSRDTSESIFFDPQSSGLLSRLVGPAIRELVSLVGFSASPGFSWGKSGSAGGGEYLLNENVESNKAGRIVPFDGYVFRFYFKEKKASGTRRLQLRKRSATVTGNGGWSTIAEVQATGGTAFANVQFPASGVGSVPVLENEELSVRVRGNSADVEDIIAGVIIKN